MRLWSESSLHPLVWLHVELVPGGSPPQAPPALPIPGGQQAKHQPLAAGVSSKFTPAVVERFGACCDELVGFIKVLTGDGDRDALRADDFTFSAASRTTYMASLLVFGAVISDAAMVERVIGMDVIDAAMAQAAGGRQRGAQGARRPTQLDIEGSGGRFWYEMGM